MNKQPDRITVEDDEGTEHVVPSTFEVCPRCNGKGVHDHPAFANGITAEEFRGPDWDDESREGYMRGDYDVACSVCKGLRVVAVADLSRCTFALKRLLVKQRRAERELAEDYASERYIRMHEQGGYNG